MTFKFNDSVLAWGREAWQGVSLIGVSKMEQSPGFLVFLDWN